jgi:peptidoglycan/xylan/chitin deacetylase (PgdA/CDA1 family)
MRKNKLGLLMHFKIPDIIAQRRLTSFHYMVFSKLNAVRLSIPNGKTKAVTVSFDVETWPNFCGGIRDDLADPYGEYFNYIPKLLEVLEEYNIKAQFFVCGKVLSFYPEVFKSVIRRGHEVGGHGYAHEVMTSLPLIEQKRIIAEVRRVMLEKLDHELKSWRCPLLRANVETYKALKDEHVTFSSNARYGRPMSIEGVIEMPLLNKMDGDILGFHGNKNHDPATWVRYMKKKLESLIGDKQEVIVFGMHTWIQRRVDPDCEELKQFFQFLNSKKDHYWVGCFGCYEEKL